MPSLEDGESHAKNAWQVVRERLNAPTPIDHRSASWQANQFGKDQTIHESSDTSKSQHQAIMHR